MTPKFHVAFLIAILALILAPLSYADTPPVLKATTSTGEIVTIDMSGTVVFSGTCTPATCNTSPGNPIVSPGAIAWTGRVGTFTVSSSGLTKPVTVPTPSQDISIVGLSTTADATITIQWTDTNFTYSDITGADVLTSGRIGGSGSVTFSAYFDGTNAEFGTGTLVGTLGPYTTRTFSGSVNGLGPAASPFSMTEVAAIHLTANSTFSTDFQFVGLPAPLKLTCAANTGQVGVPYSSSLMASGGVTLYTYSIASGNLPGGLTLNPSTGAITGTPTQAGTFSFTAQVMDSSGDTTQNTATANCTITITTPPPISLMCAGTTGQVGVPYNSALIANGGVPPYVYSIFSGTLPDGLTLNPATGAITGTPTAAGTFSFVGKVVDSTNTSAGMATSNCSITITGLPTASCVVINAVQGTPITPVTMTGSGGAGGPYTFTATGLPAGLTMSAGGTISGTPTVSGTFNYTVTVTDSAGNKGTVDCSVTVLPSVGATCVAINAVQGTPITPVTMTGSGGAGGPYTFTATGLPAGLTMSAGGTISGTPTVSGTFNYTVTVTDSAGNKGTVNCSVTVLPSVGATCVVINAVQGPPITPVTMTGSGGAGGPYTFTATGLPAGLTMSAGGTISGTPTVSGTFNYTVTVTDSAGSKGTVNCSVTVLPSVDATCVVINAVQGPPITPVTMTGSGGAGGPYTFTATGLPAGLTMSAGGTISGTPTVSGTFNYTVTVTDSAGNKGTVNCSVTVGAPPPPSITLTKSPNPAATTPFSPVTYTYTVTNTGGTTLTNITVTDDNGTPGFAGDDFVVGTIASLAPGASQALTVTLIPAINECATVNSVPNTSGGILIAQVLPTGDVKITFRQNPALVDNTYGANVSAGWTKGHKFSDLTGSDMAEFQVFDSKGSKVLDFQFDYITSASTSVYPSGYGTLGATGGDGKLISGNSAWILGTLAPATLSDGSIVRSTTTITTNLNQSAAFHGYTTNSPSTADPNYPGWEVVDGYTVYISKAAFGTNGFGKVLVPVVHNSPPKVGANALNPSPCTSYSVTNTATVHAMSGTVTITATATATVTEGASTTPSTAISVTKTASATTVAPGAQVTYTYVVTNTGSVSLTNVSVVDDNATPDDPTDDFTVGTIASLGPGASTTFTTTLVPVITGSSPLTMCQSINGTNTVVGSMLVTQLPAGAVLPQGNIVGPAGATQVVYLQNTAIVDNNYGTSATAANGWSSGHKFSDFTGSDMAEFRFTDKNGNAVLDIGIDYLTQAATGTYYTSGGAAATVSYPSGYGSVGTAGDGHVYLGSGSNVLYYSTTMTTNLNQSSAYHGFTTNSPAPSDPLFGGWQIVDGYTLVINNSVFGAVGVGGVTVPAVHNSPSKIGGVNKLTPSPCGSDATNTATAAGLAGSTAVSASATATVHVIAQTNTSAFITASQDGWSASPQGTNPAALLGADFAAVYGPGGIKIGGPLTVTLTTALAVQSFLPQGGTAGKLTKNYTLTGAANDATATEAGVLAGQVLALKLNVDFSAKGYLPTGFGNYKPFTSGPFANQTVSQILTSANKTLGGGPLPPGVTYDGLNTILDTINNLFPPQ